MATVIAFEVQLSGSRRVIDSIDQLTRTLAEAEQQAATSTFGSRRLTEANAAAAQLRAALRQLNDEQRRSERQATVSRGPADSLRAASAEVTRLRSQLAELSTQERRDPIGKGLNRELREAELRVRSIKNELAASSGLAGRAGRQVTTRQAATAVAGIGQILPGTGGNLLSSLGRTGAGLVGVTTFGVAITAAVEASRRVIALNADIDDLLGRLQKTGSLTREQSQALLNPLQALDTRTTLQELLQIGEVLGKLGIDINAQTIGAVDRLNVALSDEFEGGAEQVTNTVGKLRQILGEFRGVEASDAFLRIGNALNVLGASGAATAPVIANFASRIGGVSGPLGVTTGQILGTGAALEELGTAAERGSSGFNRILARLASAPEAFAKVLGITDKSVKAVNATAKDFADLVNKDIFGAFTLVLQRLRELNLGSSDFRRVLNELKIRGQQESEVLGKLSQSYELLQGRVSLATEALTNQNSINKEFEVQNTTLQAQLDKLGNTLSEAFVSSGFTDWLRDVVAGLNEWIGASNTLGEAAQKEVIQINALVTEATYLNQTSQERARIIGQLQELYPEYFANLNQETVSNEELLAVLREVNSTYARRFAVLELQGDVTQAQEKQGKAQADLAKAQVALFNSLGVAIATLEKNTGQGFQRTNNLLQDTRAVIEQLDSFFASSEALSQASKLTFALAKYESQLEKVDKRTTAATQEQLLYNQAVGALAGEELKAASAAERRVTQMKADALLQKELILTAVERGEKEKALAELGQLRLRASEAQATVSTREVQFVSELADKQFSSIAVRARATAAEVVRIAADTETLVRGLEQPDLKDPDARRQASQASAEAKRLRGQTLRELEQFEKELQRLLRQLADQRLDAESRTSEDRRQKAIDAEQRRYEEQLTKIREGEAKLLEETNEASEKLKGAIAATQREIAELRQANAPQSRIAEAVADLRELEAAQVRAERSFGEARNRALAERSRTETALLVENRRNLKEINERFDREDLEDRLRAQREAFKSLQEFYDKLETESATQSNVAQRDILRRRLQAQRELLDQVDAAEGQPRQQKRLLRELVNIDLQFDEQELARQREALIKRLERQEQALNDALSQNELSLEITGTLAFSLEDVDKLKDAINKTEEDITELEQKEAEKRLKNRQTNLERLIADYERYWEEIKAVLFDVLDETANAIFESERRNLQQAKEARTEAIDEEFEARLNAVEKNAIETERVEKEKKTRLEELDVEFAEKQRDLALKKAAIDGALAIIKAYASLDPISASIAAIGIAATTAIQIALIQDQEFSGGGFTGPGIAPPDHTGHRPAGRVHEGEYVMPKRVLQTPEGKAIAARAEQLRKQQGYGKSSVPGMYAQGGPVVLSAGASSVSVQVTTRLDDEQFADLTETLAEALYVASRDGIIVGSDTTQRRQDRDATLEQQLSI